jgi:hypothetical protein
VLGAGGQQSPHSKACFPEENENRQVNALKSHRISESPNTMQGVYLESV